MKKKISIALLIIIVINMIMSTSGNSVVFAGVESTTTNTFESDGGEYSLDYILNQYNVFVKENYDVEHTLDFETVLEDLGILCQKNGGTLWDYIMEVI